MPLAVIYQPELNSVDPNYHHIRNLSRYSGHGNLTNVTSQIIVTKRRKQGDARFVVREMIDDPYL